MEAVVERWWKMRGQGSRLSKRRVESWLQKKWTAALRISRKRAG